MKPRIVFFLVFLPVFLFHGCTKDGGEQTTSFEGRARYAETGAPVTEGSLQVIGFENTALIGPDRQRFNQFYRIEADGSFRVEVTTEKRVDYLILRLRLDDRLGLTTCGPTCQFSPGKSYTNLVLSPILD